MKAKDVYKKLADHLSTLVMGYPPNEDLEEILRLNFSKAEARVALAIPTRVIPLQPIGIEEIRRAARIPKAELGNILEELSRRGLLFSAKTTDGEQGYALQQVGFGFFSIGLRCRGIITYPFSLPVFRLKQTHCPERRLAPG